MGFVSAIKDVIGALRERKLTILIPVVILCAIFLSPLVFVIWLRSLAVRSLRKRKPMKETEKELYPLW